jgi:predicted nuclease of predicted toxin-antitoxin system
MACSLTAGRGIDCRDSIGGIKAVFFTEDYCDNILANATVTGNSYIITDADFADWSIISAATAKVTLLRYNLVTDLSSMTVAVSADKATGSVMYNQTLSIVLQKTTKADLFQIGLLGKNRPQIFVQDSNDNVFLMGIENGCYLTGGDTISTGAARTDLNGLTLEFTAMEKDPLYTITSSAGADQTGFPFDGLVDEASINFVLS